MLGNGHAHAALDAGASRVRHFDRRGREPEKRRLALLRRGCSESDPVSYTHLDVYKRQTLYSLLNAPDVFRAGIAGAPVTNWHNYDTIYTERYLGLPSENAEGYRASSAVEYAAKLKAKLLIVHNLEDDNVLFQNTLQMADALEQAGKIFHMVIYPQKTCLLYTSGSGGWRGI